MKDFIEKIKDVVYDGFDYIVMLGIVVLVVGIIGWRLDILFAKDALGVSHGIVSENPNEGNEPSIDVSQKPDIKDPVEQDPSEETPDAEEPNEGNTNTPEVPEVPPTEPPASETPPTAPTGEVVTITIPAGSLPGKIATILHENGVIDSSKDFIAKMVELRLDTKLKSGTFSITKGSSYEDVLSIITK